MRSVAIVLALLLAGCASYRGIEHRSTPADPAALEAGQSLQREPAADGAWPRLDWWKQFGDPQLDALIDEGIAGSPGVRLARARLDQALAAARVVGEERPQVHIADGRKERAQKNNPRSCDSPLLPFIEPHFFMECRAVYFILIT